MEFPMLLNQAVSLDLYKKKPKVTEEEFEEVTAALSLVWLNDALLDVNELLIEEQWKRMGGNGSEWEQKLVRHRNELQKGLAHLKEKSSSSSDEGNMAMDATTTQPIDIQEPVAKVEIPTIVIQEPDTNIDRKMACAFQNCTSSPERFALEAAEAPQTPPAASILQPAAEDLSPLSALMDDSNTLSPEPEHPSPYSVATGESEPAGRQDTRSSVVCTNAELSTTSPIVTEMQTIQSIAHFASTEPLSTKMDSETQPIDMTHSSHSWMSITAETAETSNTELARGTKRGSDEAGFDGTSNSEQDPAGEEDQSTKTPSRKRKNPGATPTKSRPKSPAKGKTPRKAKATPATARRSRRRH
jgi:hypothetical protein